MKAYILSIAGVILLSAVVTILCPSGKMGKFVKGTARLLVLVVMVSPLVGRLRGQDLSLSAPASYDVDGDYLGRCAELLEEHDVAEISAFLADEFSLSAQVDVTRAQTSFFPREKITVTLHDEGIIGDEERIYRMNRIREALETRYGCEVEVA